MALSDIDRALIANCLAKQEGAWTEFVDRYLPLITHVVMATARPRLGKLPSAWRDDLVSEVLLTIVDNDYAVLRQFRRQSSLGTYLVVIARRVAVRKLAKMRRAGDKHLNESDLSPVSLDGEAAGGAAELERFDDTEEVQQMLLRMPETEATAIRLFHLEQRSYSEIGNSLGIPENSVGPLLSQARSRMKSMRSEHPSP